MSTTSTLAKLVDFQHEACETLKVTLVRKTPVRPEKVLRVAQISPTIHRRVVDDGQQNPHYPNDRRHTGYTTEHETETYGRGFREGLSRTETLGGCRVGCRGGSGGC